MNDRLLRFLKNIPVDFGQASVAEKTEGKKIARALVAAPEKGHDRALDVGCRQGVQSRWLESSGYQVVSIDIEKCYDRCLVVDANERLPFADETFDLVWCSEVVEHLERPEDSLNELLRVTRRGGEIILTTPNSRFWLFRLFSLLGVPPSKLQRKDHLHYFGIKDVLKLFFPADLYGFFPYMVVKFRIRRLWMIDLLSPTFIIHLKKR